MVANCSHARLVVCFSEWQTKNNFIGRVYGRPLLLVVEPADNDWLVYITLVERKQHQVALVRNRGSPYVTDCQRHPFEQQATVLQAHVTTVVVVIPGAAMWINFLHNSHVSHTNATQFLTNDFLNCVDDSAQFFSFQLIVAAFAG